MRRFRPCCHVIKQIVVLPDLGGFGIFPIFSLLAAYWPFKGLPIDCKVARFLLVIKDPYVQIELDELDVPFDRGDLFDVLDANGNGSIEAAELVLGLLQIRQDSRQNDTAACLLAVKALHGKVHEIQRIQKQIALSFDQLPYINEHYRLHLVL